ncbi:hypothetical protein FVQ98_12225 [Ottowia sp. GY511]|uniref:DUF637 domain-containing protein n=1 Tax=Ottowia flava TaxID=2675430 RepID=A0ABW4KV70_9BURK|nr:hypothetical protein [Ottowia sp. GY511]TXK27034.1 hypothetical protein FVQ98_12225 [Ottowia sp. GY511]
MSDVAAVTNNIQQRTHDDGFLWLSRNGNLKETVKDFKGLTTDERNQVVEGLTDADLQELADDVNANGVGGANGLSADEKRDLFNTLADGLDGAQVGRLAKAFDDRDDVMALGQAVAQHADSETKVDFIKEMAPRTQDKDQDSGIMVGGSWSEKGDKEAEAILDVLSSMGNDPDGFNKAVGTLDETTLHAVAEAGINQHATYGEASVSVSHDPKQLTALLDAAAKSSDPAVKARVFDAGASALQSMRDNTKFPVVSVGTDDAAKQVTGKLTTLLNSDVRGITHELNQHDQYGKGLSTYTSEVLRAGESGQKILGEQLAQLQGAGTGLSPIEFMEQTANGSTGKDYYQNAESLGYFTGAMRNGLEAQNADATANGTMIKGIFGAAIGALSLGRAGGSATLLTNTMVDAVVSSANGDRTKLGQALQDLAVPVDANGERYQGPATSIFDSTLARVRAG